MALLAFSTAHIFSRLCTVYIVRESHIRHDSWYNFMLSIVLFISILLHSVLQQVGSHQMAWIKHHVWQVLFSSILFDCYAILTVVIRTVICAFCIVCIVLSSNDYIYMVYTYFCDTLMIYYESFPIQFLFNSFFCLCWNLFLLKYEYYSNPLFLTPNY